MGGFETFAFVSKLNGTKVYMNMNKDGVSLYPYIESIMLLSYLNRIFIVSP